MRDQGSDNTLDAFNVVVEPLLQPSSVQVARREVDEALPDFLRQRCRCLAQKQAEVGWEDRR